MFAKPLPELRWAGSAVDRCSHTAIAQRSFSPMSQLSLLCLLRLWGAYVVHPIQAACGCITVACTVVTLDTAGRMRSSTGAGEAEGCSAAC